MPAENLRLLGLVEIILSRVNRETQLQGPVVQVGFGESEHQVPLAVANVRLHGEGLAKSQKVIGAVAESNERSRQTAYPASQSDLVFAFFMQLERQVNSAILFVQMAVGDVGIIWFQLLEIT